jgi:hypothetical protein
MYTSKDIAEAIEKIPADDLDATAIAWCDTMRRHLGENGAPILFWKKTPAMWEPPPTPEVPTDTLS